MIIMTAFRKAAATEVNHLPAVASPQLMRIEVREHSLNICNLKRKMLFYGLGCDSF